MLAPHETRATIERVSRGSEARHGWSRATAERRRSDAVATSGVHRGAHTYTGRKMAVRALLIAQWHVSPSNPRLSMSITTSIAAWPESAAGSCVEAASDVMAAIMLRTS